MGKRNIKSSPVEQNSSRLGPGQKRDLTVDETGVYLGRTPVAVRDMVRQGKLRPIRHDGRVMFDLHDLDAWIEEGKRI